MRKTVVIIGGGIGSLALANLLQKTGYTVHVYEKNAQLGGRAGSRRIKGFTYDTGPSWYLMPEVFAHYFSLFSVDVSKELQLKRLSPAYTVFFESHPAITIKGDVAKDKATFESLETGAGKALEHYVDEGDKIYTLALNHFLYTDFSRLHHLLRREVLAGSGRLLWLLTRSVHSRVKRFVRSQALQQILEYPMVFLGTSPFKAPAMYSLMSALDFKDGVYYPKNGMYSIIELLVRIGRELGVTYHTKKSVTKIITKDGHANGVQLADGRIVTADIVISNADLHHTETRLLSPTARSYPASAWKDKQAGISALLLYIGVKGSLPQLTHHNLFFVDSWRQNFKDIYDLRRVPKHASLYVSRTTATDTSTAPKGHENLFMLVPLPAGVTLTKKQQETLAARSIAEFGRAINQPDLSDRIVSQTLFGPNDFTSTFNAWQGTALGMSHILKQSAMWRIRPKSKKVRNLYYVGGGTLPGIGLPMCLISAEVVYKSIVGNKRPGPLDTAWEQS